MAEIIYSKKLTECVDERLWKANSYLFDYRNAIVHGPFQLISATSTDTNCSRYESSRYRFYPVGSINTSEEIVAIEIHHVLYDLFGGHI